MSTTPTGYWMLTIKEYEQRGSSFYDLLLDLIRVANEVKELSIRKYTDIHRDDCDTPYVWANTNNGSEVLHEITFENDEIYRIFRQIHKNLNKFYDKEEAA